MKVGRNISGFTIVELRVVIVVIAILAAISIVAFNGVQERAQNSAAVSEITQNSKSIIATQVDTSSFLPASLMSTALNNAKFDTSKYKVVTYCATATEFVLLTETKAGKKYYQKNTQGVVNNNAIDNFLPCPTAGINAAHTAYLNLPAQCAVESGTCNFSGTATVVYGNAAQGRLSRLLNQTSPISCTNVNFGDPANGFPKSCYVFPN